MSEAGLFRTELLTSLVSPTLFQAPQTWASFHDIPAWLRTGVAELLTSYRAAATPAALDAWLESMVVQVAGWLSFFEGADVRPEVERLSRLGLPGTALQR